MTAPAAPPTRSWLVWLPFGIIIVLGLLFVWGLNRGDDTLIRSQWIDKPVPVIDLPAAHQGMPGVATRDFADGRPRLINVFASWCVPCRLEAQQLEALKARGVAIMGIAVRDRPDDLDRFLGETGNPYAAIGADNRSEAQLALGSSGVPETFLVDGRGVIRRQIQGPITDAQVGEILSELEGMRR